MGGTGRLRPEPSNISYKLYIISMIVQEGWPGEGVKKGQVYEQGGET